MASKRHNLGGRFACIQSLSWSSRWVQLLWLQPLAILLGVIMLCAISHVTLSTGQSPFVSIKNEINPVLAWGWAIATIMANIVWCLPQFSLGTAAVTQNLFPGFDGTLAKVGVCSVLLLLAIIVIWVSEKGSGEQRLSTRFSK